MGYQCGFFLIKTRCLLLLNSMEEASRRAQHRKWLPIRYEADTTSQTHQQTVTPPTVCTKCDKDNYWCHLAYPWYCKEPDAWKKGKDADKNRIWLLCCNCIFKYSYRGHNELPCNCENVAKGLANK